MHWLITGMSGCGKSRLLKEHIIPAHRSAGRWVGVLDPVGAPWPANWTTSDPLAFVAAAKASRSCVWIVDEFRTFMDDYKARSALEWLFYAGRNFGHLAYACAQRMKMIPPNVRDQCSHAVVFQQPAESLAQLVEQYNQPAIMQAATFPPGVAMIAEPFKPPRIIRTFTPVSRSPVKRI